MRLQVVVFSLYNKEITIRIYNETSDEVQTRKSYWKQLWMQNVQFWNVNMSWLQHSTNFLYKD